MEGDWEDSELRNFLSLGSSSRSTGSRSRSGELQGPPERAGASARDPEPLELNSFMLSALSRNGLSLLAGDSAGRSSLKPSPAGNLTGMPSLGNLALGGGRTSGGTFTGFYRAGAPQTTWGSSPAEMGLRFATEEAPAREEAAGASSSHPQVRDNVGELLRTDVENLTPDECWSLVLKLGKRWPAWNATTMQSSQGVMKYKSPLFEGLDLGHHLHKDERLGGNPGNLQLGQDSLNLLTKRALEALAHTLDRYGRPAGSMPAPKPMTHEFSKTKAASDLPIPISQAAHPTLAVFRQPTLSAQPPTSSPRVMAAPTTSSAGPRTAPLTIFYDGKINVCDNVPEDKALFIMMFAESSRINPTAQAPAPSASCAAPSTSAAPQTTPGSVLAPEESPRPQEDLQLSQPSSHSVLVTGTSCFPSLLALPRDHHPEGSSSYQKPTESSNPAEAANAAPPSMPFKILVTEAKPRQLMQQSLNGPVAKRLPNSRKNSLARFLDSRKRNRPAAASSCDDLPSKKQGLESPSAGCSNVADDRQGSGKSPMALCSQSSVPESQGITAMPANDAEMKTYDSVMK